MWLLLVCNGVSSSVRSRTDGIFSSYVRTPGAEKIQPETMSTGSELDDSKNMDQESPGLRSIFVMHFTPSII